MKTNLLQVLYGWYSNNRQDLSVHTQTDAFISVFHHCKDTVKQAKDVYISVGEFKFKEFR